MLMCASVLKCVALDCIMPVESYGNLVWDKLLELYYFFFYISTQKKKLKPLKCKIVPHQKKKSSPLLFERRCGDIFSSWMMKTGRSCFIKYVGQMENTSFETFNLFGLLFFPVEWVIILPFWLVRRSKISFSNDCFSPLALIFCTKKREDLFNFNKSCFLSFLFLI